ncbi:hypothetical protein DPSP01_012136 [Paraphaeosphaeria sporulosa]
MVRRQVARGWFWASAIDHRASYPASAVPSWNNFWTKPSIDDRGFRILAEATGKREQESVMVERQPVSISSVSTHEISLAAPAIARSSAPASVLFISSPWFDTYVGWQGVVWAGFGDPAVAMIYFVQQPALGSILFFRPSASVSDAARSPSEDRLTGGEMARTA